MTRSRVPTASAEFASADFGDERLTRRLMRVSDCFAAAPSSGLPKVTGSDGELEGVYRFLRNERVTPHKILAPHFASTLARAGSGRVLVESTRLVKSRGSLGTSRLPSQAMGVVSRWDWWG